MDFKELKKIILEKNKEYPQYKDRAIKELVRAKIAYDDNINIVEQINELYKNKNLSNAYVIPFYLGLTKEVDLTKPIEIKQVKTGSSGGLDIDTDVSTAGKPKIKEYLENKYGKECICSVGTYSTIGLASGIKDVLRKEKIPFSVSNEFCSKLDNDLSFDENMKKYETEFPNLYSVYKNNKVYLDMVPKIMNMIRSVGKHAGGILVLDKPVWKCVPVVRPQGEIASAFVENGGKTELDEIGFVKYDILGITQLDVIDNTINGINEKLYEIIDDDGIKKIVSKSYIDSKVKS